MRQQGPRRRLDVEYCIVLSPSYQVPVLYFSLRNALSNSSSGGIHAGPEGLDAIYKYLVPTQFTANLREVGIMGGISIGVGALGFPFPSSIDLSHLRSLERTPGTDVNKMP